MKILVILILAAFLNVTSQSQWFTISSDIPNLYYKDVYFVNGETGFITGYKLNKGMVMKSTNGGLHWDTIIVSNNYTWNAVFFTDVNTGYVCGDSPYIIKTTNQGLNWTQHLIQSNSSILNDIDFVDSLTGYVSGSELGVVIKTTNGGNNWFIVLGGGYPYSAIDGIDFPSKDTGYAIWKEEQGSLYVSKTTNGGRYPWIDYNNQGSTYRGLSFCNNTTGWVVNTNRIFKTTNGSFNSQSYTITILYTGAGDILALNCDTVYIAGSFGRIFKSTNGGINWLYFQTSVNSNLTAINFIGKDTVFVVGEFGAILKTTNGGGNTIGINIVSLEIPAVYLLYQNYPNPFNPVTNIKFSIPKTGFVKLTVYDAAGREAAVLYSGELTAGTYNYDFDASQLASGIYFYKLESNDFSQTKKMVLVK